MNKKLVALFLACLCLFALISCEKEAPTPTTENVVSEETTVAEEETITEEVENESELTDDVNAFFGYADTGTLENRGQQKVYHIKSASDLDKFREHLHMTEEEEKNLFLEPKDHVLLMEFVATGENSAYEISSVYWGNNNVTVEIHEVELEEIAPLHTFILVHMPFSLVGNADVVFDVLSF